MSRGQSTGHEQRGPHRKTAGHPLSDQEAFPLPDVEAKAANGRSGGYRVLARAYRPQKFSELRGQEALVRTLSNAMRTGRIAHAFLLTGIRGVGKTTTARLIARALNCIGSDGKGGPTPEPCGVCEHCQAISDSRHIDILEMDAATHTGIDDIRELVDSVRYAPTSARYKVYIVDEVHMLSEKAFNGLLKTLEEPPPQTLFIFATTEVRKVPITVLSRCQRFDLRRIESATLASHFRWISEREGFEIDEAALQLISQAADGSARDGLSLLDQAVALSGGAPITLDQVQDMLGLADRKRLLDLFETIMQGEIGQALEKLGELHERGAEPEMVIRDLLEISHWLTRLKVAGSGEETGGTHAFDAARGKAIAVKLPLAVLSRCWQMLLKGLDDLRIAPSPLIAAEMLIIRLAHAAEIPSAEAMLTMLQGGGSGPASGSAGSDGAGVMGDGQTSKVAGSGRMTASPSGEALDEAGRSPFPHEPSSRPPINGQAPEDGQAPTPANGAPPPAEPAIDKPEAEAWGNGSSPCSIEIRAKGDTGNDHSGNP